MKRASSPATTAIPRASRAGRCPDVQLSIGATGEAVGALSDGHGSAGRRLLGCEGGRCRVGCGGPGREGTGCWAVGCDWEKLGDAALGCAGVGGGRGLRDAVLVGAGGATRLTALGSR